MWGFVDCFSVGFDGRPLLSVRICLFSSYLKDDQGSNYLFNECDRDNRPLIMFAGSITRDKGIKAGLQKWFVHPMYDPLIGQRRIYDIALVKLDKVLPQYFISFENEFGINTICLPTKSYKMNENPENGLFFGFGGIGRNQAAFLKKGSVQLNPGSDNCFGGYLFCANVTAGQTKTCFVS